MTTETNETWMMSESDIANQVKPILNSQSNKAKSWGYDQHATLIANIAVEHGLPCTMKNKFKKALMIHGVGGNASQFRQWLQQMGVSVSARKSEKLFDQF
jgi:hypothetical protein